MGVTTGFTAAEIREIVHEYQVQPHGTKLVWLQAQGISRDKIQRWRTAVFEGDIERALFPRQARSMTHPGKRTSLEQQRARERAAHEAEVQRLSARVRELEATNEALGKAIGLLHSRSEQGPDANQTPTNPSDS
jgi:DNA-binding transcriptional MerR regulator